MNTHMEWWFKMTSNQIPTCIWRTKTNTHAPKMDSHSNKGKKCKFYDGTKYVFDRDMKKHVKEPGGASFAVAQQAVKQTINDVYLAPHCILSWHLILSCVT